MVTIDGVVLDIAQRRALRTAVSRFASDLAINGLGDDAMGKRLAAAYRDRLCEIAILLNNEVLNDSRDERYDLEEV